MWSLVLNSGYNQPWTAPRSPFLTNTRHPLLPAHNCLHFPNYYSSSWDSSFSVDQKLRQEVAFIWRPTYPLFRLNLLNSSRQQRFSTDETKQKVSGEVSAHSSTSLPSVAGRWRQHATVSVCVCARARVYTQPLTIIIHWYLFKKCLITLFSHLTNKNFEVTFDTNPEMLFFETNVVQASVFILSISSTFILF